MCRSLAEIRTNSLSDRLTRCGAPFLSRVRLASAFTITMALAGGSGAQDRAQDAWQDVSGCTDFVDVEMFVLEFPESRFVEDARACLATLGGSGTDASLGASEASRSQAATPELQEAMLDLTLDQRVLVQHGLASLGHEIGIVDGVFGSRTRQAIADYQQMKGLLSSGFLTLEQSYALIALGEARDNLAWLNARIANTPEEYRDYLSNFPRGTHSDEALSRTLGRERGSVGTEEADSEREHLRFLDIVGREPSADHLDENGWTDLHYAALLNLPGLVDALVDAGLNVDHRLKSEEFRITESLSFKIRPFLNCNEFWRSGRNILLF